MTTAQICLMITAFLPIACTGIAKVGGRRFDNRNPRDWLANLEGYRKRANAAQQNSWEAFALFTAAMVVALANGAAGPVLDQLALAFVIARVAFIATYLADIHWLRSLVWFAGIGLTIAVFLQSAPVPA